MNNILRNFLIFLCVFSFLIMFVGIFETTRNQYIYSVVEDNLLNAESVSDNALNEYLDFRNHYLFSNNIFIDILNFFSWIGFFWIMISAWKEGWNSPLKSLNGIFINWSLLFVIVIYIFVIIFNYLVDVFINQIIVILFNDIYTSIFVFKLFIDYFIPSYLIANLLYVVANQLRNYSVLN